MELFKVLLALGLQSWARWAISMGNDRGEGSGGTGGSCSNEEE
uniref:Uncharacterized protein n=1 Tax=Phakopsora pachyrhizi TaxID=170000 RepID=A0A0S1MJN4_PHAPC